MALATPTTAPCGTETKTGSRSQSMDGRLDMAPRTTSRAGPWRGRRQNDATLPQLFAGDAAPTLIGPRACRARVQNGADAYGATLEDAPRAPFRERADADHVLRLELGDDA